MRNKVSLGLRASHCKYCACTVRINSHESLQVTERREVLIWLGYSVRTE